MTETTDKLDSDVYEDLRERLIDRTRRNRLLHFTHGARAKIVRIVDELPDQVLDLLQNEGRFRFRPLPDPPDEPPDERTATFQAALITSRLTDEAYCQAIAAIDFDDPDAAVREERAERALRDRVREQLGLPRRPSRKSLNVDQHALASGVEPSFDLPIPSGRTSAKHLDEFLQTKLFADQLGTRLLGLQRDARSVEQETGVSTLHLAFGFLQWFESDDSDAAFVSPLLLLPVGLERSVSRGREDELRLTAVDANPSTNLSLALRLREQRLTLPEFDADSASPIEGYFSAVAEMIAAFPRWRLRRFLTLAPFSFSRIAMYRDLDRGNWPAAGGPTEHVLVCPVLRGTSDTAGTNPTFAEEYETDRPEVERIAPVLVHDADSSQHSAIIDAIKGRSLVIEGPPGTGKSQTIANLIANALHQGRTVLFVSEKMAALEVVKSRLDKVGLGPFCLPLHAAGAKPSAVMEALRRRLALRPERRHGNVVAVQAQIERSRIELAKHVQAMHTVAGPTEETVHALIGRLAELGRVLPQLPPLLRSKAADLPQAITPTAMLEATDWLAGLEAAAAAPGRPGWEPARSPFRLLERSDLFPDEQDELLAGLSDLCAACASLEASWRELAVRLGRAETMSIAGIRAAAERLARISDPPDGADRKVLCRMTSPDAAAAGLRLAAALEGARKATAVLETAGIREPCPEPLSEAARAASRLGLLSSAVADLDGLIERAAARTIEMQERSRVLESASQLLGCGAVADLGTVRLVCAAIELASELEPEACKLRRPGLERCLALLEEAAMRQGALDSRMREVSETLFVDGATPMELRAAATSLREAGIFAFLTAAFRQSKKTFVSRWRAGPLPPRAQWPGRLDRAAAVLDDIGALTTDPRLIDAVGEPRGSNRHRFGRFAEVASWQARSLAKLSERDPKGIEIHATLLALDEGVMQRLSALAGMARGILADPALADLPDSTSWSSLMTAAQDRAGDLQDIARRLAELSLYASVPLSGLARFAELARELVGVRAKIDALSASVVPDGHLTDALGIRRAAEFAADLHRASSAIAPMLLQDGWTSTIAALRGDSAKLAAELERMELLLAQLTPLGLGAFTGEAAARPPAVVRQAAADLVEAGAELSAFLGYAAARAGCAADPLARVVLAAFEDAGIALEHLPGALEWLVAWAIVRRRAEADRAVFGRSGAQLSALRASFAEADRERLRHDASVVAEAVLRRPVPAGSNAGRGKEWTENALLQHELTKQRRHVPLRDLLGRAGNAILSLTPCLMMSPLTVAQYLRPGGITFDFIVMDEASQVRPQDAVGALLRGRQAIIVGDPKQLPPTNFFDRALEDTGDDEEDAEDRVSAESVLDLAKRAFQPVRRLRWHYRSQHESLIAFSNREFYEGSLVVFPAREAPSETLGVELVQVNGTWHNKVNEREAKAVAEAVIDFVRNHPTLSHGVVSMNQPQRELIQAEIDRLAAGDPAFAAYREGWEEKLEGPFVKNLENVQGDERDVIFISLGWGRTPEGAAHQRFYPVNRKEDGHRRLNVLFTRAKRKVVLFSSLRPEDIVVDPNKTALGVRVLRDYLLFARDGILQLGTGGDGEPESPFEASVANALRARGHDVALQVGVAGYRIDIAIRHPDLPSRFVIGIECDGARYHSAKSARDRDRLRQEALERLGWRLTRVWSTDWFKDAAGQVERLLHEIQAAISAEPIGGAVRTRLVASNRPSEQLPDPPPEITEGGSQLQSDSDEVADESESEDQARQPDSLTEALRLFRDEIIMRELPGSEPNRCILREEMIAEIVRTGLDDPEDFRTKVPQWLRAKTDGRQTQYLDRICGIVAEWPDAAA